MCGSCHVWFGSGLGLSGTGLVRTISLGMLYDAGGSGLRARAGVGEADTWLGLGLGLGLG